MTRLTAVLASHNRKQKTLECLARLDAAVQRVDGLHWSAVLVDDGSSDGTADAVAAAYPTVRLLRGDGNLFWNRAMHWGLAEAMREQTDYLLWLNDDTLLDHDALQTLFGSLSTVGGEAVVVGATANERGELTYGGMRAVSRLRRFNFRKVRAFDQPLECEAMNGNVVLVPLSLVRVVGNLDPAFEHAFGDIDYALRARKAGYKVYVAPGFVGRCEGNSQAGTFLDRNLPLAERWRKMQSRKGLPWRTWLRFTRQHAGWYWPAYFFFPYFKLLFSSVPGACRKERIREDRFE